MQLMVSLHIYKILFVVTQEVLHVQFQGMILYALVLYDVLQERRFFQIKHKWLLSVLLSTPLSVSVRSLEPSVLSPSFPCFTLLQGNAK